ncbi:MAG: 1-acyl-sn-glycerol-3-phosphate acyltransferase, partial [Oscillospiraceae bacterium]|nr:1-acyl-sn-glycerol-3-phosphate acyltransferase [Oscillospiraceae bacterium]
MKTPKKWCLWRHKLIFTLLRPVIAPYVRLRYGVKVERFRDQGKRAYLIAMNHQTAYDQFLVAMSFRDPVYFIASDDLFSNGWIAKLLRFIVAPIPIKKQVTDIQAVKTCIKVAREGGTIALAPEGNRTYDGRPVNINPAIGGLAKKLGLPLALYRIEGGYGVHPRWSDVVRKGPMRAYVSRVVEPEELAALSANEVYELLCRELYVDDTKIEGEYPHPKNAEYLER